MAHGDEKLLTAEDDGFHPGDDPWHTEGSWWSFNIPERRLGGWVYHLTRRNLGIAAGGVWVWNDRATSCFEAPYFLNHSIQILGPDDGDLNDFRWPDGTHQKTLQPLTSYQLSYADRDLVELELTYDALADPYVSVSGSPPRPFRLDQPCTVRGRLWLHGEELAVSCIAMRDHSWGIRAEQTLSAQATGEWDLAADSWPVVYLYGNASAAEAFFVFGPGGYLVRDGERADLHEATQHVVRDPGTGHIREIVIRASDNRGRHLEATGKPLSLITRPSNSGIGMIYLVEWQFNGVTGWGELQDVWPMDVWSAWRRRA